MGQKANNTKILLKIHDLEDIQIYTMLFIQSKLVFIQTVCTQQNEEQKAFIDATKSLNKFNSKST